MCPRIFKKNVSIIAPIRALSKYFCTFLDWPDFHFVEYWFLLWMPFKKLWDLDSNYFFALTTMQKDSDRQCQERQNASRIDMPCHGTSCSNMLTMNKTLRSNSNRLAFCKFALLFCFWQEKGSTTTRWPGCRKCAPLQKVARSNTPRPESSSQPLVSKQPLIFLCIVFVSLALFLIHWNYSEFLSIIIYIIYFSLRWIWLWSVVMLFLFLGWLWW